MTVRRATPEDFDAVAKLPVSSTTRSRPTHEGPADPEKELAEIAEILENEIAFFVALNDDGDPVGFCTLACERAPGFGTLTRSLRRLGGSAQWRRDGADARGARGVPRARGRAARLEVAAANAGARSLYARQGSQDEVAVMTGSIAAPRGEARQPGSGPRPRARSTSVRQRKRRRARGSAVRAAWFSGGSRGSLVAAPRSGWRSPSTTTSATATLTCSPARARAVRPDRRGGTLLLESSGTSPCA